VGICTASIIFAIVNVLPEPVTPCKTWYFSPARIPSARAAMASPWSPAGLKGDTTSKDRINTVYRKHGITTIKSEDVALIGFFY
jgi:hypothetical protein